MINQLSVAMLLISLGFGSSSRGEEWADREVTIWNIADQDFTHFYQGKIGDKLAIQLALGLSGHETDEDGEEKVGQACATYLYERHGKAIELKGRMVSKPDDENKRFQFDEFAEEEKLTGKLDFQWQDPAGVNIEGEWTSADKKTRIPVKLSLIAMSTPVQVESGRCSLELRTPRFFKKHALFAAANKAAEMSRDKQMQEFWDAVSTVTDEVTATAVTGDYYPSFPYDASSSGTPVFIGDDIVSIAISEWLYNGGAHGNYWYKAINIGSERSGKIHEISLGDLFLKGTPWKKIIGTKLAERLGKQGADGIQPEENGDFDPAAFEAFVITPQGLEFAFGPSEIAGYAAGGFYTTIRWSEIAGILDTGRWGFLERWTPPAK